MFTSLSLPALLLAACVLPPDQSSTLHSPIRSLPVGVQLDSTWDGQQRTKIIEAIDQWNAFGQVSLGLRFFELDSKLTRRPPDTILSYHNRSVQTPHPPQNAERGFCQDTRDRPGLFISPVMDVVSWAAMNHQDAGGFALRCFPGLPAPARAAEGFIFIPTFNTETSLAVLKGVMLHELGHFLGLQHSCETGAESAVEAGRVACSPLPGNHPYRTAIMNPVFNPSLVRQGPIMRVADQRFENLQPNDLERAACLYKNQRKNVAK